ncbi:putative lipid carrier protein YhbT [Azospirillum fermentarium]|uniref:ubiquinone anaerobic biosynthesis accessory factor UbiT n=1 Tax=Azospirillum fermentarium TaxID=1233114 RepID=UPI00222708C0|nr:SCP2 sterol-binding domain-containing protein [Azospirillum fermentarium]MCW2248992.1 putative lipid carrier protein YhbT [Azospirillum fermentarium]
MTSTFVPPPRAAETLMARAALTLGRGIISRPFGGPPVQAVLDLGMALLRRRHPGLCGRLADLDGAEVLIDPTDMPACLTLRLGPAPRLRLVRRDGAPPCTAAVRGRFAVLLDLLEGRIDGDALFFSRDLTVEGDTETVVALRNAVDGEDMNLSAALAALPGPLGRLAPPAHAVLTRVLTVAGSRFSHRTERPSQP